MTRYEIWQKVESENARSKALHGLWMYCTSSEQRDALYEEFVEWQAAHDNGDIDGEHGEIAELIQLANLCFRRIQYICGEADA